MNSLKLINVKTFKNPMDVKKITYEDCTDKMVLHMHKLKLTSINKI